MRWRGMMGIRAGGLIWSALDHLNAGWRTELIEEDSWEALNHGRETGGVFKRSRDLECRSFSLVYKRMHSLTCSTFLKHLGYLTPSTCLSVFSVPDPYGRRPAVPSLPKSSILGPSWDPKQLPGSHPHPYPPIDLTFPLSLHEAYDHWAGQ